MHIVALKERAHAETRVAITPDIVKKYINLGATVAIETGAGSQANIDDAAYEYAGASIEKTAKKLLSDADIVLKVQPSGGRVDEAAHMKKGAILIGLLSPLTNEKFIKHVASKHITAFAMELIPRITRAQSMDALSSQSNLAGYKAVLDAVSEYNKVVPMMMTAAGTVSPAKICILGAGVAGLQAIATAKRLGAVVSAFDVRPAVKEQVESLGAKFVEVDISDEQDDAETSAGYAKEMSEAYKQRQQEALAEHIQKQDIVITTALIPGKPAPQLITEPMLASMKSGSVIVDLAVTAGGNCAFSKAGTIVMKDGVKIVGYDNVPGRVATDASKLYAQNLYNFVSLLIDEEQKTITIPDEDDIIQASMVAHNGDVTAAIL